MFSETYTMRVMAATFVVAIIALSCKGPEAEPYDYEHNPVQIVYDMQVLQTKNSSASMRMHAPVMKRFAYTKDSVEHSYELYQDGFSVDAYTPEGELETTITANEARHVTTKGGEVWCAYGDVVITNHIKGDRMVTDTIYWNREEETIYTDCYVQLTSYSGMMQGYGMTSDERARNSTILHPFDSWSVSRDSGDVYVDTINFLGPKR